MSVRRGIPRPVTRGPARYPAARRARSGAVSRGPPREVRRAIPPPATRGPARYPPARRTSSGAVSLPPYTEARIQAGDLTDIEPAKRYADVVVLLVDGKPVCGIVVEVQLTEDADKPFSWPVYVANLRAHIRCPVHLLVLTPHVDVARWAAREIELGYGARLRPLVVGPDAVPIVDDPARAASDPELAVLSAMAWGSTAPPDQAVRIAITAFDAIHAARLDAGRAMLYSDLIRAALSDAARAALEALMNQGYEYQSEWARQHRAEGEAKGKAEGEARALLTVLEGRNLPVSADQRDRILACTDLAQLDAWLRKAIVATATADLFEA